MTNIHTSDTQESHDGHTRIYNPEPIIKKLLELHGIVDKVEEENYDQDRASQFYPDPCGCAGHHFRWKTGQGYRTAFRDSLSYNQFMYLFGMTQDVVSVAEDLDWPTFSDLPEQKSALKRIEFVIKQVGGEA